MEKVSQAKLLDKYYTKVSVAKRCVNDLKLVSNKLNLQDALWIEPSAGDGAFLSFLPKGYLAFDIQPDSKEIKVLDFLTSDLPEHHQQVIFVGNPPFGKRGDKAVAFLNKALNVGALVGFIVPIQFRKRSIQTQIHPDAVLISDESLKEDSFLFEGKPYELRSCFQIWGISRPLLGVDLSVFQNLRLQHEYTVRHPDFDLYQYNCTSQSEKYFDERWDFAVLRQGYGDYSKLYKKSDVLDRKKQWMFIRANNLFSLRVLSSLDFQELSKKNTSTPGFGIEDVIMAYIDLERRMEEVSEYEIVGAKCRTREAIAEVAKRILANPQRFAGASKEGELKILEAFRPLKEYGVIVKGQPNGAQKSPDMEIIIPFHDCSDPQYAGGETLAIQVKGSYDGKPMWNEGSPSSKGDEIVFCSKTQDPVDITAFLSEECISPEEEAEMASFKSGLKDEVAEYTERKLGRFPRIHVPHVRAQFKFDGTAGDPFNTPGRAEREQRVIEFISKGSVVKVPLRYTESECPLLTELNPREEEQ